VKNKNPLVVLHLQKELQLGEVELRERLVRAIDIAHGGAFRTNPGDRRVTAVVVEHLSDMFDLAEADADVLYWWARDINKTRGR
jgi:hypothetical protein